ncbi:hypothetical protein BZA77DRAFT_345631 [Pyronema omphalodes]|nr:hypothetical protein BZA77DRAFT_345631 [Pyronema omphalodes]
MDPVGFAASVAGLVSLAIEVTKILNAYVHDVKDAPQEASELNTKVTVLSHVLRKLVDTLQSDDMQAVTIDEHSFLSSVVSSCEHHVKFVYKNIAKLRDTSKVKALMGRVSWPFQKEECLRSIETLHRYTQTVEHLLAISNRALMTQGFDAVLEMLKEQHKKTTDSIDMMRENFIPIPEAMAQIEARITTVISLVSDISRDSALIKKTSDGVTELCAQKKDEELKEILQWISPLDPLKRHEDLKSKRFEGTGAWFLKSPKFVTWCHRTASDEGFNPILACYGDPGAGKSVMSTLVIDTLYALPSTDENRISVAYFYCDYNENETQTAVNMVTALLQQVINAHSHHLPAHVIDSLKEQRSKGRPNLEESYQLLESALQCFRKFYICIDALDECLDEHRKDFLHLIARLLQKFGNDAARIFTTARPQIKASIEKPFTVAPCEFTLEANEDDIRKYIESKLDKDDHFTDDESSQMLKEQIMTKIVATANGMFLLPALQIETVLEQTSISKRRKALESMPKKLEDAFQVTFDRIKTQAPAKASQGMEVLKWTYLAKRPLSVMEMRHALATVEAAPGTECLDLDDLPFEKSLIECCHGLVVIDNETSTLRLVHKSLQDFLQDQYEASKLFTAGDRDIAFACLRYLCFRDGNASDTPECDVDAMKKMIGLGPNYRPSWPDDFRKTASAHIDRFPLLAYAIHYWGC